MNPAEYERMAKAEQEHWWYRGLRDALRKTLKHRRCALPSRANVLDAGCGTGGNLRMFADQFQPAYLGGFDLSPVAVALARKRVPEADVYQSDIRAPEVHTPSLDLIVSCDVIYIPGAQAAREGLLQLVRHLKPGGLMIFNLPAYNWLYSEHDVAIHTRERYTATRVKQLMDQLQLTVRLLTYRLCFLFPAIVLARLPSMLRAKPARPQARSDLRLPPSLLNKGCELILRGENSSLRWGMRYPWGSSIFAVGQKTA